MESRSIPITLKRRTKDEIVGKWRRRDALAAAEPLRAGLLEAAAALDEALRDARPSLPEGLSDRAEDVVEPLIVIAEQAGGAWPTRARAAAVALMGFATRGGQEAEQNIALELLTDIRIIFQRKGDPDALASKVILEGLIGFEDRPWGTFTKGDKPITAHRLSRMLKGFDVYPAGDLRFDDKVLKGYRRAGFDDASRRYIPAVAADPHAKAQQRDRPNDYGPDLAETEAQHVPPVADSKTEVSPSKHSLCRDVALSTPDHGQAAGREDNDDAIYRG